MGWFSKPKCPYCGGALAPTGYSLPFPGWRCNNCYKRNTEKKAQNERIAKLEQEISKLKNK
jgi:tRNA(Ile2) C34 agmatinyltransferase TiaS